MKSKSRRLGECLVASMVLAFVILCVFMGGPPLETRLARAGLETQGLSAYADEATAEEILLLDHFGIEALLAERRYPGISAALWARYGETPEWQRIIQTYGYQQVVPIVWRFWSAPSVAFTGKQRFGAAVSIVTTKAGNGFKRAINWIRSNTGSAAAPLALTTQVVSWPPSPLTSAERAWIAICRIDESGNNMLGRYAVDDKGVAKTLYGQTGVAILEEVALKDLLGIERKLALGREVTAADIVGGALELTIVAAATYGLSRSVAKASFSQRIAWRGAGARLAKGARTGGAFALGVAMMVPKALASKAVQYGSIGAALWFTWRYPGALHEIFGRAAEWFGYPSWVGQIAGWMMLLFPVLSLFSFLWWPIMIYVVWPLVRRLYLALASKIRKEPQPDPA